jgi:hypothetical protein
MRGATLRALRVVALGCVVAGCSPSASTIGGWDAQALDKLEKQAAAACKQRTGQEPPEPFTTDGCTLFPDGKWQSCCVDHDVTYWCGGSAESRAQADEQLRACVAEKGGPACLIHFGVRFGGHPFTPAPWRWGYGWPWPRGYTEEKPK